MFTISAIDWAYLEDWCRRLTGNFADVYVFTVPLYLPKLDGDGKWRVVSRTNIPVLQADCCSAVSTTR